MAVGVLVVVTSRQFTKLPTEAFVAGVINTTGAPTIAAPIAKALGHDLELLIAHYIYGPALSHGEVVRRIKALSADITPSAGPADHPIGAFIEAGAVLSETENFSHSCRGME